MDPVTAGLALKDIKRNTRMPLSDEEGQVEKFETKCRSFVKILILSCQGSIFSGQSGRSRGTVLEDRGVTFQVGSEGKMGGKVGGLPEVTTVWFKGSCLLFC